jgi:hypothetical protein
LPERGVLAVFIIEARIQRKLAVEMLDDADVAIGKRNLGTGGGDLEVVGTGDY